MENLRVVVESLDDLDLVKCPAVYLLKGLMYPNHNIGNGPFEEVDVLLLANNHFLVFVRVALLEFS